MSIGGLASGLDTTSIIAQLMAIEKQPRTLLDTKQTLIQTRQALLKNFQTQLKTLQTAAADLRSVTLFQQTQAVESSDATKVSVSSTNGAGVGGYQIEVQQLANAAQRTFAYTAPAADTTIRIGGHDTVIRAGATAQDVATAINTDRDAEVYAAATSDGTIVLSRRQSGADGGAFIQVSGNAGVLTEDRSLERAGRDAIYTVDGVSRTSSSNIVRDAVAGVTVTLKALTTTSGPVTVTVGAPGADTDAITRKVQAFVDAYNATVEMIRTKLDERPVPDPRSQEDIRNGVADSRLSTQKTAGSLYADRQLNDMLTTMRQAIYTEVAGTVRGLRSLTDIGITTGAISSTTSADTLRGKLTLDTRRLSDALTNDPNGVRTLLAGVNSAGGFARDFERLINEQVKSGGMLDARVTGADDELRVLRSQMAQMDARLDLRQRSLQAQFTALEVAMSKSQTQSQWLSGQLAGLSK
ncbi:flagellar filament capping protein FliD [Conexibacter sp. JD483]|uniref:flagellar filament capping protein FliD n=1 Tax=unclassified Conexibacter TaxID=2627773 RepID=UPI00272053B6|nr:MULTISPECIES: flagellar filament capping protein FliD [unclassified Conexibacter]MDO8184478.1 flagellar filament capping protein FliD [Conexibacter sp. CPCC 205706]MDO8197784.1 flagellar filament capping protein FliD [Conexibacter sp. CPCC 205762]MDR9368080.1 flagellar filament capping protein FliD [Conexibacter sp. JD483]